MRASERALPTPAAFRFAYGLLPCANSIFAIAQRFGVDAALTTRLAASLFLGKVSCRGEVSP